MDDARVQRLQDISEEDARAEGVTPLAGEGWAHPHVLAFRAAWDTINGKRSPWTENCWVWALTFRKVDQ